MEFRSAIHQHIKTNDHNRTISGYAIKWEDWSKEINEKNVRFHECIVKGAFKRSLRTKKQFALLEHDLKQEIASVEKGNLYLEEDEIGLFFKISLSDNERDKTILEYVQNRNLGHVSVSFRGAKGTVIKLDGKGYRYVKTANLVEISLVRHPAYTNTIAIVGEDRKKLRLLNQIDQTLRRTR